MTTSRRSGGRAPAPSILALAAALALACATSRTAQQPAAPAPEARATAPSAPAAEARAAPVAPVAREPAASARRLSARAQRLFDEAVAASEEQKRAAAPTDWETLERRWRAVTDAEPVPEAWFNLGVILEKRRRPDEARSAYRRALELMPSFPAAATNLALLDEPQDPNQLGQYWTDLLRRYPDDSVPRARLAAVYQAAGQQDEAWKLAREALVRDPGTVAAYKVLMKVALARGNADMAHLLALKARKLDPEDPEIVAFVGQVLLKQKDPAGAVAQWKKAVAKGDFLPARYALLSDALGKQHWEGAVEQAQAILRANPDDARVQLALGIAYRYLGQVDKALAAYDQAERQGGSKLPEVYLDRAVALAKSKEQCDPALDQLKRYGAAAGPAAVAEGTAMRVARECEQMLAANKAAEEAAREMKAEAERQAAKKAAAPAQPKPTAAKAGGAAEAAAAPAQVAPTR